MSREPLKRTLEIMPLSQEHHYSLLFSWKLKKGVEKGIVTDRILRYVKYFWENHLRQHFRQEQLVLFSAVQGNALVENVVKEQQKVAGEIQVLLTNESGEAATRADLLKLSEKMKDLVRQEERELFPELEKLLSSHDLESVSEKIHQMQPEHLSDDYEDEFWSDSK